MKLLLKILAIYAFFLVPALHAMDQKQKQETSTTKAKTGAKNRVDLGGIIQNLADAATEDSDKDNDNTTQLQSIIESLDRLPIATAIREAIKTYCLNSSNNKMEMPPLLIAALYGNTAAIKLLKEHGADIHATTANTLRYLPKPMEEHPGLPTRNALHLACSHRSFWVRMACKEKDIPVMGKLSKAIDYLSTILPFNVASVDANTTQADEQQKQAALRAILTGQKSQAQTQPASAPAAAKK